MTISENNYFDGQVKSLGYQTPDGKSTIGIINPGVYEFGTVQQEIMHVIEGELTILLDGESAWKIITLGNSFTVDANSSFRVKSDVQTAYLCQYR
ncbi:pyrimidine/purine nucleoside phosphorylase [Pedobacter mucosus]|uniref:pyrimidine/purine nucleoside phosphorylase n=1 Tax=Pedobacter mucosus TaxID=2895286 RepID=UPI001EE4333D|nr:pyrimidine/purine nucleoside phosphorylase [Pedobacter mucosus]UKT65171.1 pyrimidine/purine nucleoside phosphorylase [Pedobacter mucosus]